MVGYRRHRVSASALALGIAAAGVFGGLYVPRVEAKTAEVSRYQVAVVRVSVREANGRTYRAPTRAIRWGEVTAFDIASERHRHQIEFRVRDDGQARWSYRRDGGDVLVAHTASSLKRSTQVVAEDGAVIRVTIIPTVVSVDAEKD